jgi:DNA-binding MarR family transcriptional regulator
MLSPAQALGRAIKRLQYRHHRALDARLLELGGSLAQWDALRAIAAHPEASSHELAEATFQTDQSFGELARRLVAKALVERRAGKGRVVGYSLTEAGRAMLALGNEVAESVLAQSLAPLGADERRQLQALIDRLLE